MLLGPVFSREAAVAPRRTRMYVGRAAYAAALLLVMSTAWLILSGTQIVRDLGDFARFGAVLFQILAPLQAAVAVFFSALLAASAVAQEKDRRTLVLLLLTHLSNGELVLGKLAASLLNVAVMLAAALPLFMLAALLGGISFGQIGRAYAVTLASVAACGSLGSTLALWREKTFQALATTVLALVLWLAAGEIVAAGVFGQSLAGMSCADWAAAISPFRAIVLATHPYLHARARAGAAGHSGPSLCPRGNGRGRGPERHCRGHGSPLELHERRAICPRGDGQQFRDRSRKTASGGCRRRRAVFVRRFHAPRLGQPHPLA